MKFSDSLFFALAAVAAAGSTGAGSTTLRTAACKSPTKKSGSTGLVSSIVPSKSAVSSVVVSSKVSSAPSNSAASKSAVSSVSVSSKVSSGQKASSAVSSSKASSSASSGRPAVSSKASSSVPSSSVSSGRRVSSPASSSRASGSGGSGSSGFGATGRSSCPSAATSTVTVSVSGSSGSVVTVTVSGSGSGSGPAPTTQTSCNPSATPLPPSQDPWYNAPAGFENAAPGAVLKVRTACGLAPTIANCSAAYNILYRTTNSQYKPSWAVTTILVPNNATNNLLSYQYPYDSADVDSSPSYALYSGGGLFGDAAITAALGRGEYVVTPDYETWQASFVAGVTSGHATIDSLRATISSDSPVPALGNATYALWGYSGGALASEWALELQVQYAPELKIAGCALGGLTPNVTSVLLTINGTVYAGLAPAGILGLASQFEDAQEYLESKLYQTGPYNATGFNAARNYSLGQAIVAYASQNISLYFTNGFDAVLSPVSQRIIRSDGLMGYHGLPQPPLFVYKAIADDISVVADTDALVNRYCGAGATINYQRNTVGNHATELPNGAPRAVAFLESIFAGTYSATGCQISNVTVSA